MTDLELSSLIGVRLGETSDAALRRYVRETQNAYGSLLSRCDAAEKELKRIRKLLKKALAPL
jgi:hypothetical protein